MRKIPLSASLLVFLEALDYVEAALSADEDTKELAKPIHDEIADWDAVFKKERSGRRNVVRAEAVVAVRNARFDAKTVSFGASVLAEAGGDRKSPFFRRFFSIAPSQFVRQPLRKQCDTTLHVIAVELEKLEKKHPLRAFLAPLSTLAKDALAGLDARNKAKGERTMTSNDVDEWKEGVNTLLLSTYAELLKVAAEMGYPRSWADSFFPSDSAASDAGVEAPAAPPAPSDPAAEEPNKP